MLRAAPGQFRCRLLLLLFATTPLYAQTGRTVSVVQPPQLGTTARFEVAYPAAAAGNLGLFALSEHAPGTTSLSLPGFTSHGAVRVALDRLIQTKSWQSGTSGAGVAEMSLTIPTIAALIGYSFDVQSLDVDLTARSIYWSDNDLELSIVDAGCGGGVAIAPLYPSGTPREPDIVVDTPTALVTYLADRARDRHAREDIVNGIPFRSYDHWLPFYWEQRIAELEIVDRVAKGGSSITFRFMTHDRLNPAEFRTFYADVPAVVGAYHHNLSTPPGTGVTLIATRPSTRYPGETEHVYEATLTQKFPEHRPLRIGDRIEVELSQFLLAPRNGRNNYYGTAFLYVVGEGVVPWYAKRKEEALTPQQRAAASFDSYRLPDFAWLGGATTLPYPYSAEPEHRFKQTAGNIAPASGHEFVLGRRLHHTDFGTGAHSEPGNPPLTTVAGALGPTFVARSCVECHVGNGRSLPPAVGEPLTGAVVRVAGDTDGSPHPVLGETLQPHSTASGPNVQLPFEAESFVAMSGVVIEPTDDVGGGQHVSGIDSGDWMSFANQPVNLPVAAVYRVEFRVASAGGGGLLAFEESGGSVIHGRVSIPATGGISQWQTVTANLALPAGTHHFGLNANVGGFRLNWFRVRSAPPSGGGNDGEGVVRLAGYDLIPGTYGDGQPFELRRPRYSFDGPVAPQYFSVRSAPPLIGLGLLEAIDEAAILARHDPCDLDADGISGRISSARGLATAQNHLGRFTSKGRRASVGDQIAVALNQDMGVASALLPILDGGSTPMPAEVTARELDRMTRYVALLGVSARRDLTDAEALRGEGLFRSAGCASCHVPEWTTGANHPYAELRNQTIRPFTDLLLHDLGAGLADPMRDGEATGAEWRTTPLWNIGWTAAVHRGGEAYLHDGRARTLEEAVLWHAGEAEAAKESFRTMTAADRDALIAFLRSL